jgi:hypothetical protein
LLIADHYERNLPALQVLLVPDIFVSRQEKIEAFRFSSCYQFAINETVPSALDYFENDVALEGHVEAGQEYRYRRV